jgi:hypothetical protein
MSSTMDHLGRTGQPWVVIRFSGEDGQAHFYRAAHVVDPRRHRLIPACAENTLPPRWEHPRRQVGATDLADPDRHDMCNSCRVWARQHEHVVMVAGVACRA